MATTITANYDEYVRWIKSVGQSPSVFKFMKMSTSELQSIKETINRWDAEKERQLSFQSK